MNCLLCESNPAVTKLVTSGRVIPLPIAPWHAGATHRALHPSLLLLHPSVAIATKHVKGEREKAPYIIRPNHGACQFSRAMLMSNPAFSTMKSVGLLPQLLSAARHHTEHMYDDLHYFFTLHSGSSEQVSCRKIEIQSDPDLGTPDLVTPRFSDMINFPR